MRRKWRAELKRKTEREESAKQNAVGRRCDVFLMTLAWRDAVGFLFFGNISGYMSWNASVSASYDEVDRRGGRPSGEPAFDRDTLTTTVSRRGVALHGKQAGGRDASM